MTTRSMRHLAQTAGRLIITLVTDVAAGFGPLFLLTTTFNTYLDEHVRIANLLVVFAVGAIGYLSARLILRVLGVLTALGSLLEIVSVYSHLVHR